MLNIAIYQILYKVELPEDIKEMIADNIFEHPLFPEYYKIKKTQTQT